MDETPAYEELQQQYNDLLKEHNQTLREMSTLLRENTTLLRERAGLVRLQQLQTEEIEDLRKRVRGSDENQPDNGGTQRGGTPDGGN